MGLIEMWHNFAAHCIAGPTHCSQKWACIRLSKTWREVSLLARFSFDKPRNRTGTKVRSLWWVASNNNGWKGTFGHLLPKNCYYSRVSIQKWLEVDTIPTANWVICRKMLLALVYSSSPGNVRGIIAENRNVETKEKRRKKEKLLLPPLYKSSLLAMIKKFLTQEKVPLLNIRQTPFSQFGPVSLLLSSSF